MKVKSKSLRLLKTNRKILSRKITREINSARWKVGWIFLFILLALAIAIAAQRINYLRTAAFSSVLSTIHQAVEFG